ncbi:hypothetical protein L6452_36018 [Arctium lappa]|uniref:Uncharacterized protein n=1 Tax=Arctium lappa TaxID=4217 RepID=A0ACB8Y8S4_ARCLA|nr:hypothetical protein L6452_36018 [Arctium lappa]
MEAKPTQGKLYVPPLVLESKISELENSLSDERLLINIEQKVFSTVFKNGIISKASHSEDMFGSSNKGFDFLKSNGGLDDFSEQFDFNAKLPNHSSVVKKSLRKTSMPVNSAKSTKVDNSVSVKPKNAKGKKISQHSQKPNITGNSKKNQSLVAQRSNSPVSHVLDLSKQRPEVNSQWQPKRKLDKTVLSFSSVNCNKTSLSKDVLIADIVVLNSKLAVYRKQYTMKQLFQLSLSARKSSIYDKHVSISCQDSEDWFGNYHVHSSHTISSHTFQKKRGPNLKWVPKYCANTEGPKFQWTSHTWFLDSGCSKHMTGQKEILSNFKEKYCGTVRFGNDQFSPIMGYGDVQHDNVTIKKVSYVEGLRQNLFSIGQLCDKDLEVNFKAKRCSVRNEEGEELLVACEKGKMKRAPHKPKPEPSTNAPIELLHMDLCGPMRTQSLGGKKYILVNLQKPVWFLRTDNGTEFKNNKVEEYLKFFGISHQYYVARTPQQNGVVERRNRTLVEAARTMLSHSNLPLFLWAEAVSTACYTQNRSMVHRRFKKTPYALINNRTPTIKYFHIFRCKCFVLNDSESLKKFSAKGEEGIFIGYSSASTAFRVYLKKSKTVIESINVTFDEEMASEQHSSEPVITGVLASGQLIPGPTSQQNKSDEASTSTNHLSDLDLLFELFYDEFLGSNVKKSVVVDRMEDLTTTHPTNSDVPIESNAPIQQEIPIQMPTPTVEEVTNDKETEVAETVGDTIQINLQPEQAVPAEPSEPITSTEIIIPPEQAEEGTSGFVDDTTDIQSSNPLPHEHKWTKEHRLSQIIGDPSKTVQTRSASMNMCMHDSFLSKFEPTRVSEALADPEWVVSMQEELNKFDAHQVWRLVPKPKGKTIIGTKWVFKIKKDKDGTVIRNKARLVAKGYSQEEVIDYDETYGSCGAIRGNQNVSSLRSPQELHGLSNGREDNIPEWNSEGGSTKIGTDPSGKAVDVRTYRGMIGSLMYLKGTADLGLWYPKDTSFELTAYTDADHAGCMLDRKSTSGHVQFLGDKLVSWASKKQLCVSTSTAEGEYVASASCCSQVLWMRTQLRDYGFHFNKIPIYCDSKSAIAISANPVQHTKTKHIDIMYHFIKDHVEKGTIELFFVKTDYQLADLFTKPLDEKRFNFLISKLGMLNLKI